MSDRRVPMQGDGRYWMPRDTWPAKTQVPGTVSWEEHCEIWEAYAKKYGRSQTPEVMEKRGGFSYWEAHMLTGHEPRTWKPMEEGS